MKLFLLVSLLFLASCESARSSECDQAFAESIKKAMATGDVDKVLAFYYWEGVDEVTSKAIKTGFERNIGQPIEAVDVEPFPTDSITEYELGGNKYKMNLSPVKQLTIRFADNSSKDSGLSAYAMSVPLRKADGSCRIAAAMKVAQ